MSRPGGAYLAPPRGPSAVAAVSPPPWTLDDEDIVAPKADDRPLSAHRFSQERAQHTEIDDIFGHVPALGSFDNLRDIAEIRVAHNPSEDV